MVKLGTSVKNPFIYYLVIGEPFILDKNPK